MGVETRKNINALKDQVVQCLENDASERVMTKLNQSIIESQSIDIQTSREISDLMHQVSLKMSNLEGSGRRVDGVQKLLKSLHFDTLEYRHANIDEAHPKTFRWIFDCRLPNRSKKNKFTDWLRNDGNIFWIQGKAGSGKSTLMKFLCQHQRLRRELKHWSGEEKLVIGRYFFWNSGTKLEKSQEGLLRSLLFDILRVCPEIAVSVLSLRCGTGVDGCTISSWTREELLGIFEHLQYVDVSIKFCFFIDGLDEYKGDH